VFLHTSFGSLWEGLWPSISTSRLTCGRRHSFAGHLCNLAPTVAAVSHLLQSQLLGGGPGRVGAALFGLGLWQAASIGFATLGCGCSTCWGFGATGRGGHGVLQLGQTGRLALPTGGREERLVGACMGVWHEGGNGAGWLQPGVLSGGGVLGMERQVSSEGRRLQAAVVGRGRGAVEAGRRGEVSDQGRVRGADCSAVPCCAVQQQPAPARERLTTWRPTERHKTASLATSGCGCRLSCHARRARRQDRIQEYEGQGDGGRGALGAKEVGRSRSRINGGQ